MFCNKQVWQLNLCVLCRSSNLGTPVHHRSVISLPEQEEDEEPVLLPPPDYSDDVTPTPVGSSMPTPQNMVSTNT